MNGARLILLAIALFVFCFRESYCGFESDYLGNFISDAEYYNRTFCRTAVCMYDAGRLIYDADHDSKVSKPCDDFPTFAMGEFLKHRVLNERYAITGFINDVKLQYYEKQKRMLSKKSNVNEPKIFNVIKSFFKKCTDTAKLEKHGRWEIFDYINSLGGSPLTSGTSWDEAKFDLKKWFRERPVIVFQVLFHYYLVRCPAGYAQILCLKSGSTYYYDEIIKQDVDYVMDHLQQINESLRIEALDNFFEFLLKKGEILSMRKEGITSKKIENIIDLQKQLPGVDWLLGLNKLLLKHSKVSSETQIFVKDPEYLEAFYEHAVKYNKSKMANVLATAFLYAYRDTFIPYAFTQEEMIYQGAKRSVQRFEECIQFLESNAPVALKALEAQSLFNPEIQKAAADLAREAIQDYRAEVVLRVKDESIRTRILEKIDSIQLIVMFPDDVLNISKVGEIYEDLQLDGTESFLKMDVELQLYDNSIYMEPNSSWIKFSSEILDINQKMYNADMNTLYIPVLRTLHPWFHPNRSRFFNMATLYFLVAEEIFEEFEGKALKKAFNMPQANELAYINYKRWIENGGEDLLLSGFKLTNLQMYWLCFAHVVTAKLHRNYPEDADQDLKRVNKYLHVYLKNSPYFREAFQCEAMTENEMQRYEEFRTLCDTIPSED